MGRFWMVFVEGGGSPTHRHATRQQAEAEAERLAEKTGRRAFVLAAVSCCEVTRVRWSPVGEAEQDVPF
jgi:hypothetical protein